MLYKIAHILRDKFPWIWDFIGCINSFLFGMKYRVPLQRLQNTIQKSLDTLEADKDVTVRPITTDSCESLSQWFHEQSENEFRFFKPHGFEVADLKKLAKDKSFLAFIVQDVRRPGIVGYFFMRSFFWGKCFRGYMTDYRWRKKGVNKLMNQCATDIAIDFGMRTFGTIAPANIASMKSAQKVNDIKIIETLENGDYYVEYLPKTTK